MSRVVRETAALPCHSWHEFSSEARTSSLAGQLACVVHVLHRTLFVLQQRHKPYQSTCSLTRLSAQTDSMLMCSGGSKHRDLMLATLSPCGVLNISPAALWPAGSLLGLCILAFTWMWSGMSTQVGAAVAIALPVSTWPL